MNHMKSPLSRNRLKKLTAVVAVFDFNGSTVDTCPPTAFNVRLRDTKFRRGRASLSTVSPTGRSKAAITPGNVACKKLYKMSDIRPMTTLTNYGLTACVRLARTKNLLKQHENRPAVSPKALMSSSKSAGNRGMLSARDCPMGA
ncbi:hypothetical protein EVAR_20962_1 [Eumeta japonica]|uniref:Uncharacterized protein n=1 Tax=Eumeta variegata TaxID=151549 RepID=A0A4C1V4Y9_EUMVA|nr:hypothetical protein EVAR_20962_1 [Eumeta japonica]